MSDSNRERKLLTGPNLNRRHGVSSMTTWRRRQDPRLNFPKPVVVNGRNYWWEDEIESWERAQAISKAAA